MECLACCAHSPGSGSGSSEWDGRGEGRDGGERFEILIKFSWGQNVMAASPILRRSHSPLRDDDANICGCINDDRGLVNKLRWDF